MPVQYSLPLNTRVRRRRRELELSLHRVGEAAGITAAAVCRFEKGNLELGADTKKKIIEFLELDTATV